MKRIWMLTITWLAIAIIPVAAAQSEFTVPPSGGDDTATIQAAFDAAVNAGPGSTVRLEEGTYCIYSPIVVRGFAGNWVGAGQGQTIVKTCPEVFPVPDYIEADPAYPTDPPLEIISPFVFIEVDGKPPLDISISEMTINLDGETNPWLAHGNPFPLTVFRPGIAIMGSRPSVADGVLSNVSLRIDRIDLVGNAKGLTFGAPSSSNIDNGIEVRGGLDGTINEAFDLEPIMADISITRSHFERVAFSVLQTVLCTDCTVTFGGSREKANTLKDNFGSLLFASLVSGSSVLVSHNRGDTAQGVIVINDFLPSISSPAPSKIVVSKNDFNMFRLPDHPIFKEPLIFSFGVELLDIPLAFFGESLINALIEKNVFRQTDIGFGAGSLFGISNFVAHNTIIRNNRVSGDYEFAGIAAGWFDGPPPGVADNLVIKGNNLKGTDAKVAPIWLGPYSSNSLVVGGPNNRHVFDQGYNNVITGVNNTGGNPPGPMLRELVGRMAEFRGYPGGQ